MWRSSSAHRAYTWEFGVRTSECQQPPTHPRLWTVYGDGACESLEKAFQRGDSQYRVAVGRNVAFTVVFDHRGGSHRQLAARAVRHVRRSATLLAEPTAEGLGQPRIAKRRNSVSAGKRRPVGETKAARPEGRSGDDLAAAPASSSFPGVDRSRLPSLGSLTALHPVAPPETPRPAPATPAPAPPAAQAAGDADTEEVWLEIRARRRRQQQAELQALWGAAVASKRIQAARSAVEASAPGGSSSGRGESGAREIVAPRTAAQAARVARLHAGWARERSRREEEEKHAAHARAAVELWVARRGPTLKGARYRRCNRRCNRRCHRRATRALACDPSKPPAIPT